MVIAYQNPLKDMMDHKKKTEKVSNSLVGYSDHVLLIMSWKQLQNLQSPTKSYGPSNKATENTEGNTKQSLYHERDTISDYDIRTT